MAEINEKALVMAIRAIDSEIRRLRELPEDTVVVGDEMLLVDFENAAENLEDAYTQALQIYDHLPPYSQLVHRKRQA